jgi:hypothetical protein
MRRKLLILFILFVAGPAACSDPYSQRRIERRWSHLEQTVGDLEAAEATRPGRVREAGETLEKWWRSDCARFERRMPTVGDYVW